LVWRTASFALVAQRTVNASEDSGLLRGVPNILKEHVAVIFQG